VLLNKSARQNISSKHIHTYPPLHEYYGLGIGFMNSSGKSLIIKRNSGIWPGRYLSIVGSSRGYGFEVLGNSEGMLVLLCLMIVSISITSMLVFGCADGTSSN